MTKFTDRLENDLSHIADQASPSPTAWDAIQQRMSEPEPNNARDIIMLTDEREQVADPVVDRRWLAVAAAIAIGVLAIGAFALGRGDDDDLLVTDDPPEEVVVDGDVEEDSAPDTSETRVEEPATLVAGQFVSGLVEADLGMTMTFDLPESMDALSAQRGGFTLFYQAVDFTGWAFAAGRVGGWYDAEQSVDSTTRGQGIIPANDVEGWIEANQHITERLPDATVSGRTARVYDIQVDPTIEGSHSDDCLRCVLTSSTSSEFFDPEEVQNGGLDANWVSRLWFIEVENADPIAIWVTGPNNDTSYIDEFEATILPTIEIGPDAGPLTVLPRTITDGMSVAAGVLTTDLLGESITLGTTSIASTSFARPGEVLLQTGGGGLWFARVGGWYNAQEAIDNTYIGEGSIDARDPQAWLDESGYIAQQLPDTVMDGRTTRVWDVSIDPAFEGGSFSGCIGQCQLMYSVSTEFFDPDLVGASGRAITPALEMRVYVVEGPDDSDPYVFFVGGFSGVEAYVAEFEQDILPTIQFGPTE